jgi:hypothetical protein
MAPRSKSIDIADDLKGYPFLLRSHLIIQENVHRQSVIHLRWMNIRVISYCIRLIHVYNMLEQIMLSSYEIFPPYFSEDCYL